MTYRDLCTEVAALGFEAEIQPSELLLCAAQRALNVICTERDMMGKLEIYQAPIIVSDTREEILHKANSEIKIPYNDALAYSFITSGKGKYKITDGQLESIYDFSGEGTVHKGFLHSGGSIIFFGSYSFAVYSFSLFDQLYGSEISDIPLLSEYREYDIKSYRDDFLSCTRAPYDRHGETIKGSSVQANIIKIPFKYSGKIVLDYKKAPKRLSGNLDEEIILPNGCEHLPALLTSAYFWLDDDTEKSEYYMNLYREAMAAVKLYDRAHMDTSYKTVDRWA